MDSLLAALELIQLQILLLSFMIRVLKGSEYDNFNSEVHSLDLEDEGALS
jgi:hypothetical protein